MVYTILLWLIPSLLLLLIFSSFFIGANTGKHNQLVIGLLKNVLDDIERNYKSNYPLSNTDLIEKYALRFKNEGYPLLYNYTSTLSIEKLTLINLRQSVFLCFVVLTIIPEEIKLFNRPEQLTSTANALEQELNRRLNTNFIGINKQEVGQLQGLGIILFDRFLKV